MTVGGLAEDLRACALCHFSFAMLHPIVRFLHRLALVAPLEQLRNQGGPSGLVAGSEPCAVVAVKELVKRDIVAPGGVFLKQIVVTEYGPPPALGFIAKEDPRQASRQVRGDRVQVDSTSRTRGQLNPKRVAEEAMEFAQGLDDQKVDWKPDRPPPVRVASIDGAR